MKFFLKKNVRNHFQKINIKIFQNSMAAEKIVTRSDIINMGVDTTTLGTAASNMCLNRRTITSAQNRGLKVNFANKDSYGTTQLVKQCDISKRDIVYFSGSWGSDPVGYVISSTSDSSALQGTVHLDDMVIDIYEDSNLSSQMDFPCNDVQVTALIFRLDNGTYTTLHQDDMHGTVIVNGGVQSFVFESSNLGPEFNTSGGTLKEGDYLYLSNIVLETEYLEDSADPDKIWGYTYVAQG